MDASSCEWVVERLGDGWKKSLIALRFVGGACIDQLEQTDVQSRKGVRAYLAGILTSQH